MSGIITSATVYKEYDYSNAIPTVNDVFQIVKLCDYWNQRLSMQVKEDEEKNAPFKLEFKDYMYKKSYMQKYDIWIRGDSFQSICCKDIDSFISAYKNGSLKKVSEVTITLNLYFYRGKGGQEVEHENSFVISFKPYNIKFIRQSNHEDSNMDQIEKQFDAILSEMAVANSIFCDKSNI